MVFLVFLQREIFTMTQKLFNTKIFYQNQSNDWLQPQELPALLSVLSSSVHLVFDTYGPADAPQWVIVKVFRINSIH